MTVADELRIMGRPVAAYREIAARNALPRRWSLISGQAYTLAILGAFVSLTTTRRLVLPFVIDGFIWWSVLPLLQTLFLIMVLRSAARGNLVMRQALPMFFLGQGPFLCWMVLIAGLSMVVPDGRADAVLSLFGPIIPTSALVAIMWSNVTTFGFMRGALELTRGRAFIATGLYALLFYGSLIAYGLSVPILQVARLR